MRYGVYSKKPGRPSPVRVFDDLYEAVEFMREQCEIIFAKYYYLQIEEL